jgi:integrase
MRRAYPVLTFHKTAAMKGKKITKASVDTLIAEAKAAASAVFLWDSELAGFGAKAAASGTCSYVLQYRLGGRGTPAKRITLGRHGKLTPDEARRLAKAELGKISNGVDVAEHRKEKREKLAGLTFAEAVEKFLSVHADATRYWKEKRSRFKSADVKALTNRPLATMSRKHVADALDRAKARSEAAARLLFSDLRPFFKWAHERELVDVNPMAGLRTPEPPEARERTLEENEIKAFWQATAAIRWPFQSIYRLLLLTGARREEVAGMKWSELDLDAAIWLLPGARTKNSRDHRIPLAPQSIAILDRHGVAAIKAGLGYDDSDLVFSTTGRTSPSGFSKAKRTLDAHMKEILGPKFKEWRVHDLRRTCATGMENLGIDTRVVETALNHVSGVKAGIVGIYQRAEHREAVKTAFQAWGAHVANLTNDPRPSNVVPLVRAM